MPIWALGMVASSLALLLPAVITANLPDGISRAVLALAVLNARPGG